MVKIKETSFFRLLIQRILPFFVFLSLILYCFFDIITSPQTYHLNSSRTISKVCLISLIFLELLEILLLFVSRKKIISYTSFPIACSCFLLALLPFLSCLIYKTSPASAINLAIYPFVFGISFLFFEAMSPFFDYLQIAPFILVFYFLYIFFLIYYMVVIPVTPTSGLGFRTPTLSHIYFLAELLPLILFCFPPRKRLLLYAPVAILSLLSQKAVPLLVVCVLGVFDYFFNFLKKREQTIFLRFLLVATLFCLIVFFADLKSGGVLFLGKIMDESATIRFQSYTTLFASIGSFSPFQILFGKGASATEIANGGLAAHDDFLEYFFDYGILGLSLYLFFFFLYVKTAFIFWKTDKVLFFSFLFFLIPISLISALFINNNLFLFVAFGYLVGQTKITNAKGAEDELHRPAYN